MDPSKRCPTTKPHILAQFWTGYSETPTFMGATHPITPLELAMAQHQVKEIADNPSVSKWLRCVAVDVEPIRLHISKLIKPDAFNRHGEDCM